MKRVEISASRLKKQIETKAYAYGTSPTVCTLLAEYVIDLLREASRPTSNTLTFRSYGN